MTLHCPLCKQLVTEQDQVQSLRGEVEALRQQLDDMTQWVVKQLKEEDGNQRQHDA